MQLGKLDASATRIVPIPQQAARTNRETARPDTFRVSGSQTFTITPSTKSDYDRAIPPKLLTFPSDSSAAVAAEQNFMRPAAGLVWRSGNTLLFRTKRGSVVKLHDKPTYQNAGDSYEGYRYLDTLPNIGQWLIDVGKWEGHYFLLIDQASGKRTNLVGYPVVSPDHTRFACAGFSETGYDLDGLQLWQKLPGRPPQLLWQRLNAWGADSLVWANNQTLLFHQLTDTTRYVRVQLP